MTTSIHPFYVVDKTNKRIIDIIYYDMALDESIKRQEIESKYKEILESSSNYRIWYSRSTAIKEMMR